MTIKEFVEKKESENPDGSTTIWLKSDENVFKAFEIFVKYKACCLPVYENGEYFGLLQLCSLTEVFIKQFQGERERHYQLIRQTNSSFTKLRNLLEKASKSAKPLQRQEVLKQCRELLEKIMLFSEGT